MMVWGSVILEDHRIKSDTEDSIEEHHNQC